MILEAEIHSKALLNSATEAVQRIDKELPFGYSSGSFLSSVSKRTKLIINGIRTLLLFKSTALRPHDIKCDDKESTLVKDKKEAEGC
ncbi:hypothetical protein LCGC14_2558730 [marine sediment metagenome]|uniref:Uncharacterized protein n=1 Tax=marine sediment metagenome TaxID=412755 RepID=A0A0F9AKM8_9ZZZZ